MIQTRIGILLKVATVAIALAMAACSGTAAGVTDQAAPATAAADATTATADAQQTASTRAQQIEKHRPIWWMHSRIFFIGATYSVDEDAGSVSLNVGRWGSANSAVSVDYTTANGTAVAGSEFTTTSGKLQWAENDTTVKTITVPISKTAAFTGTKAFTVALSSPSTEATIAGPDDATVTISGDGVTQLGDVQLSAAAYTTGQSAGNLTITVNRTSGSSGAASVAYATSNGTAVAGTDFTAAKGTLEWADGDSAAKTFTVAISNVTPFLSTKTFTVALSTPSGVALTAPASATVTIDGDASPPVGSLQFSDASDSVVQNAGTVTKTVMRMNGSSGAVSVNYATSNGTAVSGTNFTAATGTLKWAAGDTAAKSFSVAISNATPFSGSKAFTVALSAPAGGATISSPGSATITIQGDAAPPVGSIALAAASDSVAQNAGSLSVAVDRVGGSNGAVSVGYATSNGTAVAGTDFTAANGTLSWAAGDTAAKTFSVPISNATPFTGNKSFTVTLSNPTGGAALSTPSSAIATIKGDAVAAIGSLQLSTSSDTVLQSAGTLTITVNRTGGSSGAVTVAYGTSGGTAVSGTDFTPTSGTLDWAAGDAASKTFSIAISKATPFTGSKSFTVALSNPTGGATLSTPSSAGIAITGSGAPPPPPPSGSGPSAPTNFTLTSEGTNSESMSWSAATAGPAPISHYQIYRNGAAYATSTTTSYTDANATNATVPKTFGAPATIYSYEVSAVDTDGNEGPKAANMTYWVYHSGTYFWEGDFSDVTLNYKDTSGAPQSGTADISVTAHVTNGYAQPFSGPSASPEWAAEIGAFNYMILDLKPTVANQTWRLNIISRLPQGDVFNNAPVMLPGKYGPAPVVGKWATYKVPLHPDLAVGTGSFVGSISGTTLTVTSVSPGLSVQTTAWLFGPGIAADTTINSFGTGNGGVGTYNLNKSASVPAGTTINMQRTNMYKFSVTDFTGVQNNVYYMDNIAFTTN